MMNINDNEKKVIEYLATLGEEMNCTYFRVIAKETELEVKIVRRACRSLARKGLTEFVRGLFNEDGEVAGSGYCATKEGRDLVESWEKKENSMLPLPQ